MGSRDALSSISTTTFKFAAYRDFKRALGKINAVVEGAELATRKFVHEARLSPDQDAFIRQVSTDYKVRVDTLDLEELPNLMVQFYIVSVHQQFEGYLRSFKRELPDRNWIKNEGDSVLKGVLSSLPGGYNETAVAVGRLEVDLADYYRLIRNKFAHADWDGDISVDVDRLRSQVMQEGSSYSRLSAPNEYSKVNFEDFVLFSRVVKQIALRICAVARPEDAEIVVMLSRLNERKHRGVDFVGLRGKKRDPERLKRALGTLLRSVYSLDELESLPIIEVLIRGPLA